MIEKPKKERRFLKALGRVGEILIQEVLIKIGSNLIKKIGGKKTLPSILFLLVSLSLFAQYPNTGNKQRLGFQTTGDGLTWRGSLSDTAAIQPINNQNAWVILDTVNLKIYSFDFTSNTWNLVGGGGSTIDTASLSNRINLKLNISDTAAMLLPYAKKSYVDTAGRFYARQDFSNVTTSTLTWTQTDTLVPAGVNVIQVYRNGQILLPSQYTIPTKTSVIIAATSFKVGENYTVIFPKGGGGSGGGSGSLTSISGGTGITVSPNPITTTGTVSADLSVLMELTDTASLSNRINTKLNISDTLSMLTPYFRDADTSSLNLTSRFALKLNTADTASLSSRINAKGTGTVTSVATGYGLSGGTITSTGTLLLDSAVVFSRIRDSIVDVAIGNDTIKILKQEYAPATTSVLTWTITPKFPIQLKAYILVFRNGQLLINDQYNLTDTNKITIVSNSFKVGANYTVVTVSGIGSVGTGTFPNPVYPEAGIAVSTGSAWASSVPNNSTNWNISFNDKITNAAFSGTNTKTLTLTQYDGGTFAPTFDDLQGIVAADTASMLTPYFRDADTSQLNLTSRFATKLNISDTSNMLLPYLRKADTTNMLLPYFRDADTSLLNLTSRFAAKLNISDTAAMLSNYNTRINSKLNISDTLSMLTPYFKDADTSQLNLTSRFAAKLNISDTASMLTNYLRSGVAASSYLPFTGGTLSANRNNTLTINSVAINTSPNISLTASASSPGFHETNIGVRGVGETIYSFGIGVQGEATQTDMNGFGSAFGIQGTVTGTGTGGNGSTYGGYFSNTTTVAGNNYGLYVTTASGGDYGIYQTGTGTNYFAGATTLGSTLAVTGNITEGDNNVLTNRDTASLSSRIDAKYNSSGGTISGKAILNDSSRFEGNVLFKKNMGLPIVKISNADYTATTANHTIIYTVLTADKTLTIPNASDAIGIKYIISIFDIPEGNEALTLVTPSLNLFVRTDGESSNVDIVGGYCTTIQSDGTKWYILSYAPMY